METNKILFNRNQHFKNECILQCSARSGEDGTQSVHLNEPHNRKHRNSMSISNEMCRKRLGPKERAICPRVKEMYV